MKIKPIIGMTAAALALAFTGTTFATSPAGSASSASDASASSPAAPASSPAGSPSSSADASATGAPGGPAILPEPVTIDPISRSDRVVFTAPPIEVVTPRFANGSPIHGGWVTPADAVLVGNAAHALDNARDMEGSTVTMVGNNGHLAINGSAKSLEQAYRIERIARNAAGGNSVAFIDVMGS